MPRITYPVIARNEKMRLASQRQKEKRLEKGMRASGNNNQAMLHAQIEILQALSEMAFPDAPERNPLEYGAVSLGQGFKCEA